MKKNERFYWSGGLVLLLILALFFIFKACDSEKEKAQAAKEKADAAKEIATEKDRAALYLAQLDTCKDALPRKLTLEERLKIAEDRLANMKDRPTRTPVIRHTVRRTYPARKTVRRNDVEETQFPTSFFQQKTTTQAPRSSARTETTNYSIDNGALPITNYLGAITGDFGTTIDGTGHLIYFIKASVVSNNKGNVAPRLNGENGAQFTLDSSTGYWFLLDSRLISGQELNSAGYAVVWNTYIGQVNYGTGSYPAYLPHQSIKALLNKVRGFEYGEITQEDLAQMGQDNAAVANGTIHPLRLNSSPGHDNVNFYHGWNFVTEIYAKKKTVTQ